MGNNLVFNTSPKLEILVKGFVYAPNADDS